MSGRGRLLAALALGIWNLVLTVHAQTVAENLAAGKIDLLRNQARDPQSLATLNTFLGRSDLNAGTKGIPAAALDCSVEGTQPSDAADWILRRARDAKVVMFNENHYEMQARVFVRGLLPRLRESGFTHIGFEAFQPLGAPGEYTPDRGHYTVEPLFAALVREATALGFVLFGYESTELAAKTASITEQIAVREQAQAENLRKAIESAPQAAKFVVFAGWSHIAKKPLPDFGPTSSTHWMAAQFVQATGIDPLSIDLTSCAYAVATTVERSGRVYLDSEGSPRVSSRYLGAVDAQVHLPVPGASHPDLAGYYRSALGSRVPVPKALLPRDTSVLIQAYRGAQASSDVAFDRVLLEPGEELPLYLPRGMYEIVSHRAHGVLAGRARVESR